MKKTNILRDIDSYYTRKVQTYGITPKGVDWKDEDSQNIRFAQLLKVIEKQSFSLSDLGCGYGALLKYMINNGIDSFKYSGYDLSKEMIAQAVKFVDGLALDNITTNFSKIEDPNQIAESDYLIASGIFNVKMKFPEAEWLSYILETISLMNLKSKNGGFSFNLLTKYSDKEFMRDDLYYADPLFLFDFCKRNFSRNVALLHDYGLYEFTIIVRR